jgi:hypothetical protein
MLVLGIIVLVASVIAERTTTIRSAQLVNAAGGNWAEKDVRYSHEGGAPKWLSAVAVLSYVGILAGIALIVTALAF